MNKWKIKNYLIGKLIRKEITKLYYKKNWLLIMILIIKIDIIFNSKIIY